MPNNKPQVMWMAKHPDGDLITNWSAKTLNGVIALHFSNYNGMEVVTTWPDKRKQGWRIVKVEVRETKKGEK